MSVENNTSLPKVSVIMPAYNSEQFIEEAIRSVLEQTERNLELIVIDDGSSDSTCEIIENLAKTDSRIRFLKNPKNIGCADTRNRGFAECRGEYIALLDSDDVWYPDKLEKQLELAEKSGADIVYCSYAIVDETGKQICSDYIVPCQTDFKKMLLENVIGCSTVLMRKSSLGDHTFDKSFYHEDFVLWLRLLKEGKKARGISEILVNYRYRANSRAYNKISSAKNRWHIYRDGFDLSLGMSIWCITHYAAHGLRKYHKEKHL